MVRRNLLKPLWRRRHIAALTVPGVASEDHEERQMAGISGGEADAAMMRRLAAKHQVSEDAVATVVEALRAGGGRMAQFSHPEFGGMSQWSGGMTMIGDMFNGGLRDRLDALCRDLVQALERCDSESMEMRAEWKQPAQWWPDGLGVPASTGAQNATRYAYFPDSQRLAVERGGHLTVFDTAGHRISGFAQQQGDSSDVTFSSEAGRLRLSDLKAIEGR
jgi:hypothetical protein